MWVNENGPMVAAMTSRLPLAYVRLVAMGIVLDALNLAAYSFTDVSTAYGRQAGRLAVRFVRGALLVGTILMCMWQRGRRKVGIPSPRPHRNGADICKKPPHR